MPPLYSEAIGQLIGRAGPPADDVLEEMAERAESESFPTVGPAVGRTLALCTRLLGARSTLELGSGFGYSAYWIARVLPADGEITLTERDADLITAAKAYFERGGLADRAVFEHGDAIEIARACDRRNDSFDLVVLDHDTADYVQGFDAVGELVAPGGAVVADNLLATEHTDEVLSHRPARDARRRARAERPDTSGRGFSRARRGRSGLRDVRAPGRRGSGDFLSGVRVPRLR